MSPNAPSPCTRPRPGRRLVALAVACLATALSSTAHAETPAAIGQAYAAQAGTPAYAERGQAFFNALHGRDWKCASCHTANPAAPGRHAATGRAIEPLAPAATAGRFTDPAKVEKWFRRNCRDVAGRECTAGEKADVIAWLLTVKP